MQIIMNPGQKIPELEQEDYLVRLANKTIIISPLSNEIIIEKIINFKYSPDKNGRFQNIYIMLKKEH